MTYKFRDNKTCAPVELFRCSTWIQKGKDACQQHAINYNIVYKAVLADIQQYAALAEQDEKKLIDKILKVISNFNRNSLKLLEKTIRESKNRIHQIDKIFQSSYEDKVNGLITDTMFKRMTDGLETEQTDLISSLESSEAELNQKKLTTDDLTVWVSKIKSCLQVETLTRAVVVELIDSIAVNEAVIDGKKEYDINIQYKFAGNPCGRAKK